MDNIIIPVVAITAVFMIPILGILTGMVAIYFEYRKRKEIFALHHQERMAAIEKGIELPPLPEDFFMEKRRRPGHRSQHGSLLSGLILVFVGLTTSFALHVAGVRMNNDADTAVFGLIPAGLGVAFLIYYLVVGRKAAIAWEEECKARLAEAGRSQQSPP